MTKWLRNPAGVPGGSVTTIGQRKHRRERPGHGPARPARRLATGWILLAATASGAAMVLAVTPVASASVPTVPPAAPPAAQAAGIGHSQGGLVPDGPVNPSPADVFSSADAVSCPSPSDCMAVGAYNANGAVSTLAERWNGSAWSVIGSQNPPGATFSVLDGISCVSVSSCQAVGYYTNSGAVTFPFAESWNGAHWSVVPLPAPAGASYGVLNGISCRASRCVAVGTYTNALSVPVTLAESWNGSAWSVVTSPNPSAATASTLMAVSCSSAAKCMAVGYDITSTSPADTLTESWDGSTWSIITSPDAAGAQFNFLTGVSCPAAADCQAVGSAANGSNVTFTLAESWNGSHWSVVHSPNPAGAPFSKLNSVSCASPSRCVAAGYNFDARSNEVTLVESWNGSHWSILPSPSPSTTSILNVVSCARVSTCLAVGTFFNSSRNYATLAESWNGSAWKIVNTDTDLPAVWCVRASHCLAVGSTIRNGSASVTLAQVWNGTRWSNVGSPNPAGSRGSYLNAITCPGTSRCVAVGYYFNHSFVRVPLIESWNGSHWSIVSSPSPSGASYSVLYAISCASASRCMAVGSATGRVLAERWNGSHWSVVPTPDPLTTAYSEFDGISCTSASHCLAVGYYLDVVHHANLTLTQIWNGSVWKIVPSPAPGEGFDLASVLNAISCVSASNCLAVGNYQKLSGQDVTLSERWTGSKWVVAASPSPTGSVYSELNGVSCLGNSRCLAIGNYYHAGNYITLSEYWNGTAWRIAHTPTPPLRLSGIAYLQGISCIRTLFRCVAAGGHGDPANLAPLSEAWNGSAWRLLHTAAPGQ